MTWVPLASGAAFDLLKPDPALVDFRADVAPRLSRIARFAGATDPLYSVAEHCVRGADAMLAEGQPPAHALAFLLHDAHEAYIGDITAPVVEAMSNAFDAPMDSWLKKVSGGLDEAIVNAAGFVLAFYFAEAQTAVRDMDLRMLRVERDHLLPRSERRWAEEVETARPIRGLRGIIKPWPSPKAEAEWLDRFARLAPPAIAARHARAA